MSICTICETPLPENSRFCPSCGTPVPGPGNATAVPDPVNEALERLRRVLAGRFEVLEELGRGGMAAVYRARQISLDRELAIKVLNPALNPDGDLVQRFLREARTQGRLEHHGIIPVYEVYQEGGLNFYTMPRIQGPSLRLYIKENPRIPIETVRRLLAEAADALGYAHRQGLIHRDVKPENILMDSQRNRLVLTDFGIAKTLSSVTMLTLTGEQLGTPRYMAPDQSDTKRPLDGRSDQYSLGLVGYEMLAGHMAFQADSLAELMYKHRYEDPEPLGVLRPDAPAGLTAAIMRAISKNRDERFPTMEAFAEALQRDEAPPGALPQATEVLAAPVGAASPVVPAPVATEPAPPVLSAPVATEAIGAAASPQTPLSSGGVWRHDPVKGWILEPALMEPIGPPPPSPPGGGARKRSKGGFPPIPPLTVGGRKSRFSWKWIILAVIFSGVVPSVFNKGRRARIAPVNPVTTGDLSIPPGSAAIPGGRGPDVPVGPPIPPPEPFVDPGKGDPAAGPPGLPADEWIRASRAFEGIQAQVDSALATLLPGESARVTTLQARAESLAAAGDLSGGTRLIGEAGGALRRLGRRAAQIRLGAEQAGAQATRARTALVRAGLQDRNPEALEAADQMVEAGDDFKGEGRLIEAEKSYRAAAKAYGAIGAAGGASAPGTSESAPPAAPADPAAAGEAPDAESALSGQLDRFAVAFASEDLDRIRGAFPDLMLDGEDVNLFKAIFDRTDELDVARRTTRITGEGAARTVEVEYLLRFKQARTHENGRQPLRLRFQFNNDGSGRWTLRQVERP